MKSKTNVFFMSTQKTPRSCNKEQKKGKSRNKQPGTQRERMREPKGKQKSEEVENTKEK
jgi:hypothetical protein